LKSGCSASRDQVIDHLAARLPKWWLPDDVIFVNALPMTATGKIRKADLRDAISAGAMARSDCPKSRSVQREREVVATITIDFKGRLGGKNDPDIWTDGGNRCDRAFDHRQRFGRREEIWTRGSPTRDQGRPNRALYVARRQPFRVTAGLMAGYFEMVNASGGINGRKVTLISLDNAFSPPRRSSRRASWLKMTACWPMSAPSARHPTSRSRNISTAPRCRTSSFPRAGVALPTGRVPLERTDVSGLRDGRENFGQYILKNKPDAKVGVLYQNDDYGKDFLVGLKAALGDKVKIVAEVVYEITEPTIDSSRSPEGSGADALLYFSRRRNSRRKGCASEGEWVGTPLQFLASRPTRSKPY